MRQKSWLMRLIGVGTWTVLLALALATLLRWRGRSNAQNANRDMKRE
jgi:hypothetical protein